MNREDVIRQQVLKTYKNIAVSDENGCGCGSSCCGPRKHDMKEHAEKLGYSPDELDGIPMESNMGLGCGNPQAIALLKEGETVLDLGCGGGFDCFLAAKQVGETGLVIGVDMTPEMVGKARNNALKSDFHNVEFRLGEIEHLPVADNSVDVIISNCVINLSPDKKMVYQDAYRVLKNGGRLAISDIVATNELPDHIRNDLEKYSGCVAGAALVSEIEADLADAGFSHVRIDIKEASRHVIKEWFPNTGIENFVVSAAIEATK